MPVGSTARPPELYSEAAEEALIGSILLDSEILGEVARQVAETDFATPGLRRIYRAMLALRAEGQAVDLTTVSCRAAEQGGDEVALLHLLSGTVAATPSAINYRSYVQQVHEDGTRRQMLQLASRAAQWAYDRDNDLADVLRELSMGVLDTLADATRSEDRLRPIYQVAEEAYALIESVRSGADMAFSTGFGSLDTLLGGWRRGSVVIVAARPGIGKSAFLLTAAYRAAQAGKHAAVFSLEMTAHEVFARWVASFGQVPLFSVATGNVRDAEIPALYEAIGELSEMPLYVDDSSALSVMQLRAKAERLRAQGKLDILFVDYLQLMAADKKHEKRYQEIGEITRGLKALAKDLAVPIVVASQVTRVSEGRPPTLADLRESGDIEQDADAIVFFHRERSATGDALLTDVDVAKHRYGPTGSVDLFFIPRRVMYVSANALAQVYREQRGG